MIIDVRVYETTDGKQPFSEWLHKLKDKLTQIRIRRYLNRIAASHTIDCKPVGAGVYELRLFFGPGYRIYFGETDGTYIILLCGGDKSSQDKDIKKAKKYWQDCQERKGFISKFSTFQ